MARFDSPLRSIRLGFTLVELLVVVAILVLLAALLFPVLSKARERGKDGGCISNLAQIGKAMALYATDHDDCLPYGPSAVAKYQHLDGPSPDPFFAMPTAESLLAPYGASKSLLRCPRDAFYMGPDPNTQNREFVHDRSSSFFGRVGSSYLLLTSGPGGLRRLSDAPSPSEKALGMDAAPFHGDEDRFGVVFRDLHTAIEPWSKRGDLISAW